MSIDKRVMFVLPRLVIGGVERITLNLIKQLQANGVTCCLPVRRKVGGFVDEASELVEVFELAPRSLAQFVPSLSTILSGWRPSHVVSVFSDVTVLTLLARSLSNSRAPVVCGVHNSHGRQIAPPGVAGYFRYLRELALARLAYRGADALVAGSEALRNEVIGDFGISPDNVRTIYNPIVSAAERVMHRTAEIRSTCHLVSIGRLVRQKGFDLLIEAMAQVRADRQWRLSIFGCGPEEPALRASIQRLGLSDKILLCGDAHSPLEELQAADAFILPSRFEGLPTVLVLAAAAGLPIIATDCPHGPAEVLEGGKLGRLVQPESAQSLSAAIDEFLSSESQTDTEGLRRRAEMFSVESSAAAWLDLFEELSSTRRH